MFKKLLVFLFICMVLVANCEDITIKSITTTPSTDPTAVDNGKDEKTCTGITVSVELSSAPISGSTVSAAVSSHAGDVITVNKVSETNYEISGITLAEGASIDSFTISIDGTPIALDKDVTTPTIKCLSDAASSSSASSSSASSDSTSSQGETDVAPKIQTFTIATETAVAATNAGHLYCKEVRVDFTLDKVVSTDYIKPTYKNLPAIGKAKTNLADITVPNYYFLLDVAAGGNLDDLTVTYKDKETLDHSPIKFTCTSATGTTTDSIPSPTSGTPNTQPTEDSKNDDGSFASTISINSMLIVCFTISSILLLQQF